MDSLQYYTISSNRLQKMMGFRHCPENPIIHAKTLMHFSEMLLCLVLISWYSPTLTVAVHVTGGCLLAFSRLLTRPLSVFIISNAIIVAVAILSAEKETGSSNYAETKLQNLSAAAADTVAVEVTEEEQRSAITEEEKNPVEDLSTEEFNRTVEKYIARTKSLLQKERLDEIFQVEISH